MDSFLLLVGLGGLAIAIVDLVRPTGWLGLVNRRRRAGFLLAASLVAVLGAGAIGSGRPDREALDAAATTIALEATADLTGPAVFVPPWPGPSGDPYEPGPPGAELATVVHITDGDTLTVSLADGRNDTVRLIGIDTPESAECFAEEATDALAALVPPGSEVAMTLDTSDRDRFGRLLRYLWVGQMSVNEEMIRRGAAVARRYPPDTALAEQFDDAQAHAMAAELGLWACGVSGP